MTRFAVIFIGTLFPLLASAQAGDQQLRAKADALFDEQRFAEAMPLYSQLVSLSPGDRKLNYHYGTCLLFGGDDKEKAIGHLKFATEDPGIPTMAWYWLGRAYHLNYRFKDAQAAYQRFVGTGDKKALAQWPVDALEQQCRNGEKLLSNLKEITVRNKVEVEGSEFFRFYDLTDIGGKIVVMPEELKTSIDKKNKLRSLVYLPEKGGPIYFGSYGKDGKTGLDIYRTELMPEGTFAPPVKLAGYINTDQDEDYAFMHPDGKSFYFSSKGHNSMGGYDVFRATFDKGLDAFGRPENLDFAVNTPDDDIFYMVDAEHKEACFASGRSSKQGKLHVYRVGTAQVPLIITVLKGTFANQFDAGDRKAHILVEDAVTREKVADVRTDINGSYVLSLPRSGKFRFLVECGPTGKTHAGQVDVPRSDGPKAYRQELTLTKEGDLEKLVIRNYFDTPLEDDIIALALDEIKRRARLDITDNAPVAQAAEPEAPVGDVMTRAGFTGDIDKAAAVRLAQEDAAELDKLAADLEAHSEEAFGIAVDAVTEAERTSGEAEALVAAAAKETTEEGRNAKMVEAARMRQRSREAHQRARAAFRTGQDLDAEHTAVRQRAATADRLATDLQSTLSASRDDEALVHLKTLKERLDTKSRPDGDLGVAEKSRRAVTENEREAAKRLTKANASRTEETELATRVDRLKREREAARGGRKEELDREIAGLEEQLGHLHKETETAFTQAREQERETAVLRGQASLTRHLTTAGSAGPGTELTDDQVSGLGQRIGGAGSRIASIPIDERYDAQLAGTPADVEARMFDWDLASAADAAGTERATTQAVDRSTTNDAQRTTGRTTEVPTGELDHSTTENAVIGEVPVGREDTANAGGGATPVGSGQENTENVNTRTETAAPASAQRPDSAASANGATNTQDTVQGTANAAGTVSDTVNTDQANARPTTDLTPEQVRNAELPQTTQERPATTTTAHADPATERFVMENRIAELRQLQQAERDQARKDSLGERIGTLTMELAAVDAQREREAQQAADAAAQEEARQQELAGAPVDMQRGTIVFEPRTAKDEDIIRQLHGGYAKQLTELDKVADADARASGLHDLETMLADSIRGEMVRQLAVLELDPAQAERVLPRVDRLRRLRQDHLDLAQGHVDARQAELAEATGSNASDTTGIDTDVTDAGPVMEQGTAGTMLDERFIQVEEDPLRIYASTIEHRAGNVDDATAFKEADLGRMEDLQTRIDSLEDRMNGQPRKEYDKLRKDADRLLDEQLIIRADLGQRTAFLMKEEWNTATDSMKVVEKDVTRLGFAPNEPVLVLAQDLRTEAQRRYDEAQVMRKKADRMDDIIARDDLYRKAYKLELESLQDMDRSLTVHNYLTGGDHVRGEALTYEEVAAKVLGINEAPLSADGTPQEPEEWMTPLVTDTTSSTGTIAEERSGEVPVDTGSTTDNASTAQDGTEERAAEPAARTTTEPVITPAVTVERAEPAASVAPSTAEVDLAAARDSAEAQARRTEARLIEPARRPMENYESYLRSAPAMEAVPAGAVMDPKVLSTKADEATTDAADLERRSLEEADRATAFQDSSLTARKRDRERLEVLAVRTREVSDSLHKASGARMEEARLLTLQHRHAEQVTLFRERLVKFYYLTSEEGVLVMENVDYSRYFEAKARALEQYSAATEATAGANSNRELGEVLRREALAVEAQGRNGRMPQAEAQERAKVLNGRANVLLSRADSLTDVAARLRGAANMNESQATVMLQAMEADRSTELMALEMRTRRTETLLGEAQAGAGAQRAPLPAGGQVSAPATTVERTAEVPAATTAVVPERTTEEPANVARTEEPVRTAEVPVPVSRPEATAPAPRNEPLAIPEVLTTDLFELRPATERRTATIPMDAPMPKGIVFKVQVGAFRTDVPNESFSDMTPVTGETAGNGFIRYTAGMFTGFDQAAAAKDQVRDRGYRDAFVVAYKDGERVPLGQAMREVRAQQEAAGVPVASDTQRPATTTTVRTEAPATTAGVTATIGQPVAPAAVRTPEEERATILASYPSSAEEIIARFAPPTDAANYYNEPGAAPARQVETVKGLFFTVQVGVYSKPVPLDRIFNITPLNSERTETAKVRYTTGLFLDTEAARIRKDETVGLGVKDAFVTAYLNGKRIPMREATALLEKFGPSILAKP